VKPSPYLMSRWFISFVGQFIRWLAVVFAPLLPQFEDSRPARDHSAHAVIWAAPISCDVRRARDDALARASRQVRARRRRRNRALRDKLATALELLKKTLPHRGYLYEHLYAIIGRPVRQDDSAA